MADAASYDAGQAIPAPSGTGSQPTPEEVIATLIARHGTGILAPDGEGGVYGPCPACGSIELHVRPAHGWMCEDGCSRDAVAAALAAWARLAEAEPGAESSPQARAARLARADDGSSGSSSSGTSDNSGSSSFSSSSRGSASSRCSGSSGFSGCSRCWVGGDGKHRYCAAHIFHDDEVALAIARHLDPAAATLEEGFRCALGSGTAWLIADRKSGRLYLSGDGATMSIGELWALLRGMRLSPNPKKQRMAKGVWGRRAAFDAGSLEPLRVDLPPLPEGIAPSVAAAREGFALLAGLWWLTNPNEPLIYAKRFVGSWCGISATTALGATKTLATFRVIEWAGELKEDDDDRGVTVWLPFGWRRDGGA